MEQNNVKSLKEALLKIMLQDKLTSYGVAKSRLASESAISVPSVEKALKGKAGIKVILKIRESLIKRGITLETFDEKI